MVSIDFGYRLVGDDLKICFAGESKKRPVDFNSKGEAGGRCLLVLRPERAE